MTHGALHIPRVPCWRTRTVSSSDEQVLTSKSRKVNHARCAPCPFDLRAAELQAALPLIQGGHPRNSSGTPARNARGAHDTQKTQKKKTKKKLFSHEFGPIRCDGQPGAGILVCVCGIWILCSVEPHEGARAVVPVVLASLQLAAVWDRVREFHAYSCKDNVRTSTCKLVLMRGALDSRVSRRTLSPTASIEATCAPAERDDELAAKTVPKPCEKPKN